MSDKPTPTADEPEQQSVQQEPTTANLPNDNETDTADENPATEDSGMAAEPIPALTGKPATGVAGRAMVGLVLTVVVGAGGAYGFWNWQQSQNLEQTIEVLNDELQQQREQLTNANNQLGNLQRRILDIDRLSGEIQQQKRQTDEQRDQIQAQLRAQAQRIAAVANTTTDDWKLAEAYYLTRLAGQRLLVERKTIGALALLEAADEIVKSQSDPQLITVREQLAQDILSLKLIEPVDQDGIYLRLAALKNQLERLPNSLPMNFSDLHEDNDDGPEEAGDNDGAGWRESLNRGLAQLKSLVEIRYNNEALDALPTPEYQRTVKTRMVLLAEMAQLSLLKEQQNVYQSSLEEIDLLLERYYRLLKILPQLRTELSELQSLSIQQNLPNINQSQQLLGDYLNTLHQIGAEQ